MNPDDAHQGNAKMRIELRLVAVACLAVSLAAGAPPRSTAQDRPTAAPDENALVAVLRELRSTAQGALLVDPRALRPEADLIGVEAEDLGASTPAREQALARLGIARTDIVADQRCEFAQGLPAPPGHDAVPDSIARIRAECRARAPFTAAVLGEPRADDGSPGLASVTVVEITVQSYAVREYVLRRVGDDWRVVRREDLLEVFS